MTTWEALKTVSFSYMRRGLSAVKLMATNSLGQSSGYEAAAQNRRLSLWRGTQEHINQLLSQTGRTMNARARHLTRNSAYAVKGKRSFVGNAVGTGIEPMSKVQDRKLRSQINDLFLRWTDEADADGLTDFYGLQTMVAGSMFEVGECFARLRPRRVSDGLSVPLQIQLLESEQLPLDHYETLPNGNQIRAGIEFNLIGKRVAYHFLKEHPGDRPLFNFNSHMTVRVPAGNVLHMYEPLRPGQIRGQTQLAAAMVKTFLLDIYDDAELDRKKTAALFAGFVRRPADMEGTLTENEADDRGVSVAELSPGTMNVLLDGEEVDFSEPADVGGNYEAFQRRTLLAVAAAMGVPYENVTGDLRNVSYSSLRAGVLEFRRCLEQWQHQVMVYQFCRPVWRRWMDTGVLSGAMDLPGFFDNPEPLYLVGWIPVRWEWVDPLKDRQGQRLALELGVKSRSQAVREEGGDIETLDQEIAQDRAREKELGLSFPRGGGQPNGVLAVEEDESGGVGGTVMSEDAP